MKKCMFIGHRNYNGNPIAIHRAIHTLISCGVAEFYSGGMGNFDKACEDVVRQLGGVVIYVPYHRTQIKAIHKCYYDKIVDIFGDKAYGKSNIPTRNRWMVDHSDICLCYAGKDGGAMDTVRYAVQKGKPIINLFYTTDI